MSDYEADRVRSVINALVQVRQHVANGGYDAKYPVSIFNRWVDTLLGEPLENARSLRLRWFYIARDPLLLHLDATMAFLAHELAALEGGNPDLLPDDEDGEDDEEGDDADEADGGAEEGRGAGWTPRVVKD